MVFNSFHFLVFFVFNVVFYFILPHRYRWMFLLATSCYFYMAFVPVYILILAFTTVVDYTAALHIQQSTGTRRKFYLAASMTANVGVLAFFKYYNFLNDNLTAALGLVGAANPIPVLSIVLPIGLSFHTFQAMGYTIDVYRGKFPAEKHFGIFALYVMFFPQLVAGPIERCKNLLNQFYEKHSFRYEDVTSGLRMVAWGIFKKVVIADRLALVVDAVNSNPHAFNSLSIAISALFFAIQAYCDFSGYSDIGIGTARILGFRLMKNFDAPFLSRSFYELWKRWHISLSSWFRDYLYIPLGGNRVSTSRWYFNILFVFFISGLWHGAGWNYVLFGVVQGIYVTFGIATEKVRDRFRNATGLVKYPVLRTLTTFILFVLSLIIFRATSIENAMYMLRYLFTGIPSLLSDVLTGKAVIQNMGIPGYELALSFFLVVFLQGMEIARQKINFNELLLRQPLYLRWSVYYAALAVIVFLGVFENRLFIYFQF